MIDNRWGSGRRSADRRGEVSHRAATTVARSRQATLLAAVAAVAGAAVLCNGAHGAVRYAVTNLGTLGGFSSDALSINASGQVVGYATDVTQNDRAFIWTDGTMTNLGTFGGFASRAFGINAAGAVVGWSETSQFDQHAFVYQNGVKTDIGTLGGTSSVAYWINSSGQIVGESSLTGGAIHHAFRYSSPTMTDLSASMPTTSTLAYAINNSGETVGWTEVSAGAALHAAKWSSGGTLTDLGVVNGFVHSVAESINDAGTIVGYSADQDFEIVHATRWIGGTPVDIGTLGGSVSVGYGINTSGLIVGTAYNVMEANRAAKWVDDGNGGLNIVDLNTEISASSGWVLQTAFSLNDRGQIVGAGRFGGFHRGFLLTPVFAWINGAGGGWGTGTNWEPLATPTSTDDVLFNLGSSSPYTVTTSAATSARSLFLQNDKAIFNTSGGTLSLSAALIVGQNTLENGQMTIADGTITTGTYVSIASQAGGTGSLTVSGAGATLQTGGGLFVGGVPSSPGGAGTFTVGAGATVNIAGILAIHNTVGSSMSVTGGSVSAGLTVNEKTYTQSGGIAGLTLMLGSGTASVSGGTMTAQAVRQTSLSVSGSGTVQITAAAGSGASRLNTLSIAGSGDFDINDNKLIVQFGTSASPLATIRQYIINGRNGTDFAGGNWNGTGGISSTAAANQDLVSFAVGYVENSFLPTLGLPSYTSFGGQNVDSGSLLIRYTLGADANLDGKVNTDDVTIVGALYGATSAEWAYGDFDYDGVVDSDDVTVLGALYDPTAPALSEAQMSAQYGNEFAVAFERGRALAASGTAVPEPGAAALGLAGVGLLGRRRRRSQ